MPSKVISFLAFLDNRIEAKARAREAADTERTRDLLETELAEIEAIHHEYLRHFKDHFG